MLLRWLAEKTNSSGEGDVPWHLWKACRLRCTARLVWVLLYCSKRTSGVLQTRFPVGFWTEMRTADANRPRLAVLPQARRMRSSRPFRPPQSPREAGGDGHLHQGLGARHVATRHRRTATSPPQPGAKTSVSCTHHLAHGSWPLDRGCLHGAETRCLRDFGAGVGPVVEQGGPQGQPCDGGAWERGSVPTRAATRPEEPCPRPCNGNREYFIPTRRRGSRSPRRRRSRAGVAEAQDSRLCPHPRLVVNCARCEKAVASTQPRTRQHPNRPTSPHHVNTWSTRFRDARDGDDECIPPGVPRVACRVVRAGSRVAGS